MSPLDLDIVIPARSEEILIAPCLRALLWDGDQLRLQVIVALNGESVAETQRVISSFEESFSAGGHSLRVVHSAPGKVNALNAGDRFLRGCSVIYLDADVVVSPGFLMQMARTLTAETTPILACPRVRVAVGKGLLNRAYSRVWSALPVVRDGVIGGGCYAVNPAGRALWGQFPDVLGDDAFVCALFSPDQRRAISPAAVRIVFPETWRDLVATRARWLRSSRDGRNAALALRRTRETAAAPFPPHAGASRWSTLLSPKLLPSVPFYLAVDLAARLVALRRGNRPSSGWRPLREPRP